MTPKKSVSAADNQGDLFGRKGKNIIDAGASIAHSDASSILYQHSFMCSVFLPYRDPKANRWEASDGHNHLLITARDVLTPEGEWTKLGVPFGPRPRVTMLQFNDYALTQGTRHIEIDHSMRLFLRRMGLGSDGRTTRAFKAQMQRVVSSDFTFARKVAENRVKQVQGPIVDAFEMWFEQDQHERLIWPESITLSERYFKDLTEHAVPLDMRAIRAIQTSAMQLDLYCWLASRLHRVNRGKPQFIPWPSIRNQFPIKGQKYMAQYRRHFIQNLNATLAVYPQARVVCDQKGVRLHNCSPPVRKLYL